MMDNEVLVEQKENQGFVLVGKTEFHEMITSNDGMEQLLILRETEDADEIHVISINAKFMEVLIRECAIPGVSMRKENHKKGHNPLYPKHNNNHHHHQKHSNRPNHNPNDNQHHPKENHKNRPNAFKSIQATTRTICPDCSAELEVSLNIEVDTGSQQQQQQQQKQPRNSHNHNNSSSQHQKHKEETDQSAQLLWKENKKQQKRIESLQQERQTLQSRVQTLQDAHQSSQEAYDVLHHFSKKKHSELGELQALHQRTLHELETIDAGWQHKLQKQQTETQEVWDMLDRLRGKYRDLARRLREISPTPSFNL